MKLTKGELRLLKALNDAAENAQAAGARRAQELIASGEVQGQKIGTMDLSAEMLAQTRTANDKFIDLEAIAVGLDGDAESARRTLAHLRDRGLVGDGFRLGLTPGPSGIVTPQGRVALVEAEQQRRQVLPTTALRFAIWLAGTLGGVVVGWIAAYVAQRNGWGM